jgi:hypothetical protein
MVIRLQGDKSCSILFYVMTLYKYFIYNFMLRQAAAGVRTAYNGLEVENKKSFVSHAQCLHKNRRKDLRLEIVKKLKTKKGIAR